MTDPPTTPPRAGVPKNPGDEVAPGTPLAGEAVCPDCGGSGRRDARPCASCGGSGKVIQLVGDA